MKTLVMHAERRASIERTRDGLDDGHHVGERHWSVARSRIQRVAHDVLGCEIRGVAVQSGCDRCCKSRVGRQTHHQLLERANKRSGLLRCDIETENFDGNQAIAVGRVRAKNRTERSCADLMENPKRPECLWWEVQD